MTKFFNIIDKAFDTTKSFIDSLFSWASKVKNALFGFSDDEISHLIQKFDDTRFEHIIFKRGTLMIEMKKVSDKDNVQKTSFLSR